MLIVIPGKYLLALKCLIALHAIDSEHPMLHVQSYRLRGCLDRFPSSVRPKISELLPSASSTLLPSDEDISEWNKEFLDRHGLSAAHTQAGLRVRALIGKENQQRNEQDLLATLSLDNTTMVDASRGLELLHDWRSSADFANRYRERAAERWNRSSRFQAKHI